MLQRGRGLIGEDAPPEDGDTLLADILNAMAMSVWEFRARTD